MAIAKENPTRQSVCFIFFFKGTLELFKGPFFPAMNCSQTAPQDLLLPGRAGERPLLRPGEEGRRRGAAAAVPSGGAGQAGGGGGGGGDEEAAAQRAQEGRTLRDEGTGGAGGREGGRGQTKSTQPILLA